ncbi:MAG: hypothetical protein HN392_04975 [Anaerolineae bacterium]|jgi:hypothetical protein|nr:hypothetical protein [Anaerolineae bacterium]MBT7075949.1 hypothetical protein [Anaerolineae bacterium]MBT7782826.1 hypothetical protein [Anaerolineae bacterium]
MKKLPTDLEILNVIYEQYYEEFKNYTKEDKSRDAKIYVPIDVQKIASKLKVDVDIVFGRLYYHLDQKFRYKQDDGSSIPFFALKAGNDIHSVNFPFLASVLASLRDDAKKHRISIWIAIVSLIIALISIAISISGI